MTTRLITVAPELAKIAKRVIWFEPPEEALSDKVRFLCYLMRYGLPDDITTARHFFTETDFKHALKNAYPGILDKLSWAYWNLVYFNKPNRPMPKRRFTS